MRFLLAALLATVATTAGAQGPPTYGTLYSTQERARLTYDCAGSQNGKLECDFHEVGIRKTYDEEEIQRRRTELQSKLTDQIDGDGLPEDVCSRMGALRTKINENDTVKENVKKSEQLAFDHALAQLQQLAALCEDPSTANVEDFVEFWTAKARRTCSISSQSFEETFVRSSPGVWVSDAEPSGSCGVVSLDRFTHSDDLPSLSYETYNFTSEKVITNPEGEGTWFGLGCSEWNKNAKAHEFTTPRPDIVMSCRHIEFGY